ncbi:hypothetical protein EH183_18555 [Streptomyces sp. CB01881]|nr:hypothetical protein C2142_18585 [Streptomyces sp. CB01881]TYC74001.1 hypothetical protein EH183_18555 [Streptomyces sp. CB01881]
MKLLLDENVPLPMARIVRLLLKHHVVEHVAGGRPASDLAECGRPVPAKPLRIVDPASAPPKFWPADSQG